MKDEVEDFLRRVAQMRAQAEAQAKAQQQRPSARDAATPQQPQPQQQQQGQRQQSQARRPRPEQRQVSKRPEPMRQQLEPVEAEIVTSELRQRDAVSRHVQQHLRGPEQIAEHTRHLGEEVDQADDKLAARLHQVFDHQLGQLTRSDLSSGDSPPPPQAPTNLLPSDILRLLRSPQSVRDALIMSEIFNRPQRNW
jgi:hypothetical protein